MDEFIPTPTRDLDKGFIMPVEGTFSIAGRGTVRLPPCGCHLWRCARGAALLACFFGFHVACVPYRLDLRIANACLRRRLPVFNQLPECLSRMHQRAPSRAQDAALHTESWSETET